MNKYFKLYTTSQIVETKKGFSIYNTLTGDVINLSETQKNMIIKSENGELIENFDFYNNLSDLKIGEFFDHFFYTDNNNFGENDFTRASELKKLSFKILHIQVTNECNYDCKFCNSESNLVYRHTGCKRWNTDSCTIKDLNLNKYIEESYFLGCDTVILFGGNPFLIWDKVLDIIVFCRKIGIKHIKIYSNGSLINNYIQKKLLEFGVELIIQISKLTQNYTYLGKIIDLDYKNLFINLKELGIPFEINVIVSKYNENEIPSYLDIIKKLNIPYKLDILTRYPENCHYSKKYSALYNNFKNKLIKTTTSNFNYFKYNNPCYSNIIAIGEDCKVYPCIMTRVVNYGMLNNSNSIVDILKNNENYYTMKNLSKDKIKNCRNCSYKYACVGCTAIELRRI